MNVQPPTIIDTARLHLRRPVADDSATIFAQWAQDREVTRYLTWKPHTSLAQTQEFVRRCAAVWTDGAAFPWIVRLNEDDQIVGMIELRVKGHRADIGYVIARRWWGQGIAAEAAGAVVGWAMAQSSIFRVWAVCDCDNRASARVLEKAGMQREGVLRRWMVHPNVSDEPRDCFVYARIRDRKEEP